MQYCCTLVCQIVEEVAKLESGGREEDELHHHGILLTLLAVLSSCASVTRASLFARPHVAIYIGGSPCLAVQQDELRKHLSEWLGFAAASVAQIAVAQKAWIWAEKVVRLLSKRGPPRNKQNSPRILLGGCITSVSQLMKISAVLNLYYTVCSFSVCCLKASSHFLGGRFVCQRIW